jgi:acetyl esterase/lipase
MKKILLASFLLSMQLSSFAQNEFPLYNGTVPNSKPAGILEKKDVDGILRISNVTNPTLTVYPAKGNASGAAVVICPGGGYSILAVGHEGSEVANLLASWGITAFVLKYRLPSDAIMQDKSIGPLQDAQRAIQLVRERAAEWKIDPQKIGIMGFSAGGHLASTAGTHFTTAVIDNPQHTSLRPDFMILGYPVISFADSICHKGSKVNLIGKNPSQEQVALYSNELQITQQTPPTFLVHAEDDKTVPVQNSLYFYESLLHHGVPAEMHLYPKGGHGFGLHNKTTPDEWSERLHNWLKGNGWAN